MKNNANDKIAIPFLFAVAYFRVRHTKHKEACYLENPIKLSSKSKIQNVVALVVCIDGVKFGTNDSVLKKVFDHRCHFWNVGFLAYEDGILREDSQSFRNKYVSILYNLTGQVERNFFVEHREEFEFP